jgi:hypothetical protein
MRPLEIAIVILVLASLAEPLIRWHTKPRWFAFVPSALLLVVVAQILMEGYRWQMVPLYIFACILFVLTQTDRARKRNAIASPEFCACHTRRAVADCRERAAGAGSSTAIARA